MKTETIVAQAEEVPGWMTKKELTWLVEKAKSLREGSHWAELGSYCGRSLLAVGLALPAGSTLVSVDINWGGNIKEGKTIHDVFRTIRRERREEIQLHAVLASTDQAADAYRPNYFDVVFIDANHAYEFCRADIRNWSHLVKPKGLICGHDYGNAWPGVRKAVDELLPGSEVSETIWHHQCST